MYISELKPPNSVNPGLLMMIQLVDPPGLSEKKTLNRKVGSVFPPQTWLPRKLGQFLGIFCQSISQNNPWDWYIYLHEWLICMVNVGKYTSPVDGMGIN